MTKSVLVLFVGFGCLAGPQEAFVCWFAWSLWGHQKACRLSVFGALQIPRRLLLDSLFGASGGLRRPFACGFWGPCRAPGCFCFCELFGCPGVPQNAVFVGLVFQGTRAMHQPSLRI